MKIAAGEFKAKCLKLMDDVQKNHEDIIITKYGKPIAKLTAIENKTPKPLFGFLKNSVIITGDIITPTGEKWYVDE
ncbi:MAG: type II toxin-antitoxin system prevent-host-death family antitoxin [Candidatus Scalindua sp. AMX11]|nr:MAG: type II toxin-antitoxin system prevent-host-death family antitoxin [Candidatus Scalindua sp.]NOG84239.1 type II toxin-antitoxin system prevent-host-death family antitoxin [Planctomycetota bacterium]RZV61460.1 MAG: type II toxin-antitoxin system prevent-host-death family antitoxin [Candidatus Scalindua sp. SCAELEC01]TDE63210.1 MAG: type II toxin-antitoxin system prevent-host-death family antitoxin [Candidatus Scalindua sp. AMX11]GJQ57542.1 MAG: antitoxin [Candidatus Scalindua sp.]